MAIHGTCSLCGGPVMTPEAWGSVIPPTPTCGHCGATKRAPHGPVIEMEKPSRLDSMTRFPNFRISDGTKKPKE